MSAGVIGAEGHDVDEVRLDRLDAVADLDAVRVPARGALGGEPALDRERAVALRVEQLEPHRLGDVRLGRDLAGQDLRHRTVGVDAAVAGELIEARLRCVA